MSQAPSAAAGGCTLLQGSTEFFPALIDAMAQARHDICFETYLFETAGQGQAVAQALEAAALRGIEVRVVIDGVGSRDISKEWLERWSRAGVKWRVFEPLGPGGIWFPTRWRRLHRKLCVVDQQVAFCGGINILDDLYDPHTKAALNRPRLDYAVRLTGAWVPVIHATMAQLWWRLEISRNLRARFIGAALDAWREIEPPPTLQDRGEIKWVLRDNWRHRHSIVRSYLQAIGRARQEIWIANAFFFPARRLRVALQKAAQRGVKVSLLLPGYYEYEVPYRATRVIYRQLLAAGVEIHEYHASYLHAKVAVIDGRWATVGSSNLDPLSLLMAREANLVIQQSAFASELRWRLEHAMNEGARPVQPGLERLPWWQKALDQMAYALMRTLIFLTARNY